MSTILEYGLSGGKTSMFLGKNFKFQQSLDMDSGVEKQASLSTDSSTVFVQTWGFLGIIVCKRKTAVEHNIF